LISAVDRSVIIDALTADPQFGDRSRRALDQCRAEGGLVACDVVWAEVTAGLMESERLTAALAHLEIQMSPLNQASATFAGSAWKRYRLAGGRRQRIIADFLIGAHAQQQADRLLTRDRGFYRHHFADLAIVDPSGAGFAPPHVI
jgi:predicted nucleic acid-binding protein